MDLDGELLQKVCGIHDFFGSVFLRDDLDDWSLARDFGEFLVRTLADQDVTGHALLTRAYRHLGNMKLAHSELRECLMRTKTRELKPWELELFGGLLESEEKLLGGE